MPRTSKFDKYTQGRLRILQNADLDEREALQRTVDLVNARYNKAILLAHGMAGRQESAFRGQAELHGGVVAQLAAHLDMMPPSNLEGTSWVARGKGQGAAPSHPSRASETPQEDTAAPPSTPAEATSAALTAIIATELAPDPISLSDDADDSYVAPQPERRRKGFTATEMHAVHDAVTEPGTAGMSSELLASTPLNNILGEPGEKFVALGFQAGRAPYFGGYGPGTGDQLGFYIGNQFTDGNSTVTGLTEDDRQSLKFVIRKIVGPGCVRIDGLTKHLLPNNIVQQAQDLEDDRSVTWILPLSIYGTVHEGAGYAAGIYVGCYTKLIGTQQAHTFETQWVIGFWGAVGMSAQEIDVASMKQFDLSSDSILTAIGYSCLRNLVNHQNTTIELRELSLRTGINDPSHPNEMVKTPTGNFIVVKSTDRRNEFPGYAATGILPDDLRDVPQPTRTNMRGRIVFVDWSRKMIHYYTESGKLHVKLFGTGTEVSNFDYEQLYQHPVSLFKSDIDAATQIVSDLRRLGKPVPPEARTAFLNHPWDENLDGFRSAIYSVGLAQRSQEDQLAAELAPMAEDPALHLTLENLVASYKGDQTLYNLAQSYYDVVSFDMAHALVNGYSFTGTNSDTASFDDVADPRSSEQRMRIPLLGVLLHLVGKPNLPTPDQVQQRFTADRERMQNPDMNFIIHGIGKYLNQAGVAEIYKLKPHQVRVLGMLLPLDKGIIDVDMGGGKSIIAILKIISMIERLKAEGKRPRPLVVVPNALVPTFYREIKKFTRTDPADATSVTTLNVVTLQNSSTLKRMNRDAMIAAAQHAPDNTIFIASYSWLAGDRTSIHTGEYITGARGKKEPRVEYRFNRVEDLLDRIGINIVFLDECHKIKANGRMNGDFIHKAAMALSRAPYRFEMTGTFISRTPFDIFNQVKFIDPTILGSLQQFKDEFTENDGRTWDSDSLKRLRSHLINRGVITVRREEWLYLMPEKREHFHFVDFQREAPIVYKLYKSLWTATLSEFPQELNQLLEGGTLLGGTDSDTDLEVNSDIINLNDAETEEQESNALTTLEQAQHVAADQIKTVRNSKVAGRMMALRALISAPEKFPMFTAIADKMRDVVNFNIDDLKKGPKDDTVLKIIEEHFRTTGGTYVKPSEQVGPEEDKAGKIIIFSDRALIARHFETLLRERYGNGVCYYDSAHRQYLDDFSDPDKEEPFILCAVENSIKEGVNLQSASRIIRLTVPWTTGDYDQSCARAFRTGQKKRVDIDNVICEMSFEPAMLARLITRENTNKKVSSNYNNSFDIPEITVNLKTASPDGEESITAKRDLENFQGSSSSDRINLLNIHDSIYTYEKQESRLWKVAYLTKLTDNEELAHSQPDKYITRETDRTNLVYTTIGVRAVPDGTPADRLPVNIPAIANMHILGVPLKVVTRGTQLRAVLYTPDPNKPGQLALSTTPMYQLDESNDRLAEGSVADSTKTYEPWPTTGIRPDEMAKTSDVEVEDDDSTEDLLTPEEKMEKRISTAIDEATDLNLDPRFTKSLKDSPNAKTIKSNLVKVVKKAALNGEPNPLFHKSKAMGHLFQAATGLNLDQKRPANIVDAQIKQASRFVRHNMNMEHAEYSIKHPEVAAGRPPRTPAVLEVPSSPDAADRHSLRIALGMSTQQNTEVAVLAVDFGISNPLANDFYKIAQTGRFGRWSLMNRTIYRQIKSTQDLANLQESMEDRGMKFNFDDAARNRNTLQQLLNTLPFEEADDDSVGLLNSHAYASVDDADEPEEDPIESINDWAYMALDRKVILYVMDTPATAQFIRPLLGLGFKRATRLLLHFTSKTDLPRVVRKIEESGFELRSRDALNARAMRILKTRLEDPYHTELPEEQVEETGDEATSE